MTLHTNMENDWREFATDAPDEWTQYYLDEMEPLFIAIRYGQNSQIYQEGRLAQDREARQWGYQRDYNHIRYFSFAIATDIR